MAVESEKSDDNKPEIIRSQAIEITRDLLGMVRPIPQLSHIDPSYRSVLLTEVFRMRPVALNSADRLRRLVSDHYLGNKSHFVTTCGDSISEAADLDERLTTRHSTDDGQRRGLSCCANDRLGSHSPAVFQVYKTELQ